MTDANDTTPPSSKSTVPAPASRDARVESAIPATLKALAEALDIVTTPAGARTRARKP